jgi:hypothetical protein
MLHTSNHGKLTINMGTSTKFRLQKCHEIRRKTIFHVIMSLKSLHYKKSCTLTCKSLKFSGPLFHVFIYPKLLETPRLGHSEALKWNQWLFDSCQVLWRLPHMFIAEERSRETCKTIGLYPTMDLYQRIFLGKDNFKVWTQMSQAHSIVLLDFLTIV